MQIGGREFQEKNKTYVMGILNVTPDSFSDGGRWMGMDCILRRVEEMIAQGMDILDIGGESTRPGHIPVSAEEELERVLPVIRGIRERFDVPISLDTSKSRVALAGIQAGADMINDVWGLQEDPTMARVIGDSGVACCLMHNRHRGGYGNLMEEVTGDLKHIVDTALAAGISPGRIVLDPGIGFAKNQEENLELLGRLGELGQLGYPLLLGASRKSVIGNVLALPVQERLEGTLATTVLAALQGCMFVRVHDVEANVRAIRMTEAVVCAAGTIGT